MSSTHTAAGDTTGKQGTARQRIIAVVAAAVAAVVVWVVADPVLGVDVAADANGTKTAVELPSVIGSSLVIGLVGWGFLAVLEKVTGKARTVWTAIAVVVFLLSLLFGPGAGVTTGAKATLVALHTVVALVLIPGLARNARKD